MKNKKKLYFFSSVFVVVILILSIAKYMLDDFAMKPLHDKRSKELAKSLNALELKNTLVPLSAVMHGDCDSYFVFVPMFTAFMSVPCCDFDEDFLRDLNVKNSLAVPANRLIVFNSSGIVDEATLPQGRVTYDENISAFRKCFKFEEMYLFDGKILITKDELDNPERFKIINKKLLEAANSKKIIKLIDVLDDYPKGSKILYLNANSTSDDMQLPIFLKEMLINADMKNCDDPALTQLIIFDEFNVIDILSLYGAPLLYNKTAIYDLENVTLLPKDNRLLFSTN